jgi:CRP-like cAMP-binding protein
MLADVLALTEGLPERRLEAGGIVFREGDASATVAVLVEGHLIIDAGGVVLNNFTLPGTFVGEIGALLNQERSASVVAATDTVIREIGDPTSFFASHPELGLEVARQLAGRLHRLTAYIGDVQRQFGDRDDHMAMFGELLSRISSRPVIDIEPGSDRSPDY